MVPTFVSLRFNLSHLEQWIHENHLDASDAVSTLQPIVQVAPTIRQTIIINNITI
jgi:hypothetical protein